MRITGPSVHRDAHVAVGSRKLQSSQPFAGAQARAGHARGTGASPHGASPGGVATQQAQGGARKHAEAMSAASVVGDETREPRRAHVRRAREPNEAERDGLAPFRVGFHASEPLAVMRAEPVPGSPAALRREAAMLAERVLASLRVGRSSHDRDEVRLRLRGTRGSDLEVRIEERAGRFEIAVASLGGPSEAAEALAAAVRAALSGRHEAVVTTATDWSPLQRK